MFTTLNNIESSFKRMRLFMVFIIVLCFALTGFIAYKAFAFMSQQRQQIYVLADGQSLVLAKSQDIRANRPVEGRDHVRRFHQLFFSLDPDEQVIRERMREALYYGDNSVQAQYQNLKESGYFNNIISANISQEVVVDSIVLNDQRTPYYVKFYGRQKVIRASTITYRNLITECYLRDVTRTDNNPHGFLMERWTILNNSDLSAIDRATGEAIGAGGAAPAETQPGQAGTALPQPDELPATGR